MIRSQLILSLAVACSLWACASPSSEPERRPAPPVLVEEGAPPEPVERIIEPSREMLAAALAGDTAKMQLAAEASLSSCPQPSTCPSSYGSCTAWSALSVCNYSCTQSALCACPFPEHPDNPCEPDPYATMERTSYSSYRVCFNAQQQACTEFKLQVNTYCGC